MPDAEHSGDDVRHRDGLAPRQREDARWRRSRADIGLAFAQLLTQQDYEQIRVNDILQRAGVGRATFYAHHADKHALMVSELRRITAQLLRPDPARPGGLDGRPLFAHLIDTPALLKSLSAGPSGPLVLALAQRVVAEHAAATWASHHRMEAAACELPGRAVAALLFMLLEWQPRHAPGLDAQGLQQRWDGLCRGVGEAHPGPTASSGDHRDDTE